MSASSTAITQRARQASHSVRRFFDAGNIFRFLVSILLAFGLWALVTYQNDPETTRVMGGIPVTVNDIASDFELVGDPPTVDITIQGPQSIITTLEREQISAVADMEEIQSAGVHDVDVEIEAPADVRVRDVVPETVSVEIDRMIEVDGIPISVIDPVDVPTGLAVDTIEIQPDTVIINGPARAVQQVEEALVELQIAGRTTTFVVQLEPLPVDENGDPVEGVSVLPSEVSVTVSFEESRDTDRSIAINWSDSNTEIAE